MVFTHKVHIASQRLIILPQPTPILSPDQKVYNQQIFHLILCDARVFKPKNSIWFYMRWIHLLLGWCEWWFSTWWLTKWMYFRCKTKKFDNEKDWTCFTKFEWTQSVRIEATLETNHNLHAERMHHKYVLFNISKL